MQPPKRVLCIMDLSFYGRAGLAVVVPALAACGAQACPVPAALFSTHTGGYGTPCRQDTAAFGRAALEHFAAQGLSFQAIYVGYLYGDEQFALANEAIDRWPGALVMVDPAMADNGKLYGGITPAAVAQMRALCGRAGLITPNCTESALLAGEDPAAAGEVAAARARVAALAGGRAVVVTSVPTGEGGFETRGCGPGEARPFAIPSRRQPAHYPGTGDLFAAALLGSLLAGDGDLAGLARAAATAARFVEAAAEATCQGGGEPRQGLWFEPFLPMLGAGAQ